MDSLLHLTKLTKRTAVVTCLLNLYIRNQLSNVRAKFYYDSSKSFTLLQTMVSCILHLIDGPPRRVKVLLRRILIDFTRNQTVNGAGMEFRVGAPIAQKLFHFLLLLLLTTNFLSTIANTLGSDDRRSGFANDSLRVTDLSLNS